MDTDLLSINYMFAMSTLYPAETTDGVVTSFIPLTDIYTPSASCNSIYRQDGPSLIAYDPGYGFEIDDKVDCEPSAVTTWWEQGQFGGGGGKGHTAVSIGPIACPNDWPTVASSVRGSSTLLMCCPSAYSLENGVPGSIQGDCRSEITSGAVLTYAATDGGVVWSTKTTTLKTSSYAGAIAIVGWNIEETSTSTTTKSSSTLSSSTHSTSSDANTTASTQSSTSHTSNTLSTSTRIPQEGNSSSSTPDSTSAASLSPGAKAGIGIGISLGAIGIAALVAALLVSRRRKSKKMSELPAPQGPVHPQQWPLFELNQEPRKAELDSQFTGRSELQAHQIYQQSPVELGT
ncbi:hypothetical protein GGR57DRAFT_505845 [Xylariaceae sp. FL1272]|nr:hypothetical protein GGR57DRAFT_505845 [Xylariaceae sp. FL1272]